MNIWPVFIALGRLGVLWITNYRKRKMFMTMLTLAFLMHHMFIESKKLKKREHGNDI